MVSEELLGLLVCPACKTKVKLARGAWLVCQSQKCRRKYPIVDDIPVMLIEEGDKYIDVPEEELGAPQ